jgi:hypothetical protein
MPFGIDLLATRTGHATDLGDTIPDYGDVALDSTAARAIVDHAAAYHQIEFTHANLLRFL